MGKKIKLPRLPMRSCDAHKGSFGKICIIGGSRGMSGAAAITARSALRSGAGLTRVAVPGSVLPIVAGIEPCCTTISLAEDRQGRISSEAAGQIRAIAEDNDVIAFGPGCGVSRGVRNGLGVLLGRDDVKLVIDADGLNCLAKEADWYSKVKAPVVITPHPGEMKRLWERVTREAMPEDRETVAAMFAERIKCVTVLKGHQTVVAFDGRCYVNATGNAGMATPGAGDCLTGVIAAMIAQGLELFDAAVLGVYLHGSAGDIAADKRGQLSMTATDIVDCLSDAILSLKKQQWRVES